MANPLCNKRMPDNVPRCDEKPGHVGHHVSRDQDGKVIASWPNEQERRRRGGHPRRAIKAQSDKQAIREAVLAGIKAERCWTALKQHGEIRCTLCGRRTFDAVSWGDSMNDIILGVAMENIELHHTKRRSSGRGYTGTADFGVDHPEHLALICRSCHRKEHAEPEFSDEGAA